MHYNQILQKIYTCYPMYHKAGVSAYKEGLENIEQLAKITAHPERCFKSIHIAGTNGKGSTAHFLASYCQEAGLKTGLFTSPHLIDFRERIKINGKEILKKNVVAFFERYHAQFEQIQPSFFEMTTILAFSYFAQEKVDIAIIETGLGGRLDATNIIDPLFSIITNISLEHQQLLGNTLAKIAFEKAGIIKPNKPVIVGETTPETLPVFQNIATERKATLILPDKLNDVEQKTNRQFLVGNYQQKNLAIFYHAVELLKKEFNIEKDYTQAAIENVVINTNFSGRWQIIQEKPLIICDVAHNFAAFQYLVAQVKQMKCDQLYFVIGFVNDKDIDPILEILPQKAIYYLCEADTARALKPEALLKIFEKQGLNAIVGGNVQETFILVKKAMNTRDLLMITGSCFVVGDFLRTNTR